MTISSKLSYFYCLASMALALFACSQDASHGHLKEDEALSNVHIGSTNKDATQQFLGSPSSESTFGPTTWYYISSVQKTRSLLAPEIIDQHVTEVTFDSNGIVSGIKQYNLSDSKDIQIASRTTPSEGQTLGFFEQIVSNLGRFNKKDTSGSGITNSHGSSLPPVVR